MNSPIDFPFHFFFSRRHCKQAYLSLGCFLILSEGNLGWRPVAWLKPKFPHATIDRLEEATLHIMRYEVVNGTVEEVFGPHILQSPNNRNLPICRAHSSKDLLIAYKLIANFISPRYGAWSVNLNDFEHICFVIALFIRVDVLDINGLAGVVSRVFYIPHLLFLVGKNQICDLKQIGQILILNCGINFAAFFNRIF